MSRLRSPWAAAGADHARAAIAYLVAESMRHGKTPLTFADAGQFGGEVGNAPRDAVNHFPSR
jgi:hypothetical protein